MTITNDPLKINVEFAPKINFACHQNSFAILQALVIENLSTDERFDNLNVVLTTNPEFVIEKRWHIDQLAPGESITITDRDITLNGQFLLNLADSMHGHVTLRIERNGIEIHQQTFDVDLLAFNEWGGGGYMPELLAAFCTPNDPVIDRILKAASDVLRKAGKSDAIDGYQSGQKERVWELASAIYSAVVNLGISYANPPASFEKNGQKVRLPGVILENKLGTCLDLAALFAAALEQAGLNPIIALPEGHALVGVWLQPETMTSIVTEEPDTLRKRSRLQELLLFETTCATKKPPVNFSTAVASVEESISPDLDDRFCCAVDIKRARAHSITPLGMKSDLKTSTSTEDPIVEVALEEAPPMGSFDVLKYHTVEEETPKGRLLRWQQKLLDLTLRNPLLNHRASASSLKILCPDAAALEDKISAGAKITVTNLPEATSQAQDEILHKARTGQSISSEYARAALDKNQVLVDLHPNELSRRSIEIYRRTQTALQEGGANTLYLALGFLLWKREDRANDRFRAPLILLPVSLERQSVKSPVKLVSCDDEPRFNTTLLEMLRTDFAIDLKGFDGALPTDQSGIDVNLIWNTVRHAIKDISGFEVVEDVVLGHFSFAKYLMWKDLVDRTAVLKENRVVKHLLDTPKDDFKDEIEFVDPRHIDRDFAPGDLFIPLPTDASQIAAIATADRGKDFVIIGPPGTGKSQTIANMIAHLLGQGKTVLFVSEKTAALEVVYRRLSDMGVGRFCLELHSNKARKVDVLNQLRTSWETMSEKSVETWKREAQSLKDIRDQLNTVVERLHAKHPNGLTAHHAIGTRVKDEDLANSIRLQWSTSAQHSESDLAAMCSVVEKLQVQAQAVGSFDRSPLSVIASGDWSPQREQDILGAAKRLEDSARKLEVASRSFCTRIGIVIPDELLQRLHGLSKLADQLLNSHRKNYAFALDSNAQDRIDALEEAVRRLKTYAEQQSALSCPYDPMAWRRLDGLEIQTNWSKAKNSWFLKRLFLQYQITKKLKAGGAKTRPNPEQDGLVLQRLREEGSAIDALDKKLADLKDWQSHVTDPVIAENLRETAVNIKRCVGLLADDTEALVSIRTKIKNLMTDGNDLLASDGAVGRECQAFIDAYDKFSSDVDLFQDLAGQKFEEYYSKTDASLPAVIETVCGVTSRGREIRDWCAWRKKRDEAVGKDLLPLVEKIEDGSLDLDLIEKAFDAAYCGWFAGAVIGEDKVLREFSTAQHAASIQKFRQLDQEFQKLSARYVTAKLSGNLPEPDSVRKSSQWGILRHELQKKSRHKPVRALAQEIPDVLKALAPCLMMSPLSVAQYLPAEQKPFDVVIFDEASQITVWDAVGAIARGQQTIIAGDPKQMPPTNFFARAETEDDFDTDVDLDLESILDEMLGASVPKRSLNLHYRSKRESLIAFSNAKYYDNSLTTFPAPFSPDKGVSLVRPDGFYARGGARHNEGEAKAIVAEILRRLKHPDISVRQSSIGVVTFNSEQQNLIENLLDEAREKNPDIEWAFKKEADYEPVFIKNLETVQGDERDVILFSITYGPDQAGNVTMNFGPLNRTGGERRLNVAMTRARSEMVVFSTLKAEQIDLHRTRAHAVVDLKHFLEYAERGPSALGAFTVGSVGDYESPFEQAVAEALKQKGWRIDTQVGISSYRIDLGVVHPDKPGAYLVGVECDGAMYHSSQYARERDKIRQQVLEGLGWKLIRVWSTDWWTNRPKALEELHNALNALLAKDRAQEPVRLVPQSN